jgi:type VI secretion system protein ImpG
LRLRCQADQTFDQLTLESLRFHLNGDARTTNALYELLLNHAVAVELRSADPNTTSESVRLEAHDCLSPVGFADDESLVPYTDQSFAGYRLLTELFSFPEKFLFFDLGGMQQATERKMGRTIDVLIFLDAPLTGLEHSITAATFRMGCTPVVNLFERVSEPVRLTHRKPKYRVTPDYRRPQAYEVYSIDSVSTADSLNPKPYRKFYDYRHASPWATTDQANAFWYNSRVESHRAGDHGTDMYLHPVDLDFNPAVDSEQTLVVRTTCTNRDLPVQLQHAGQRLHFELESAVPLRSIKCLRTPTTPLRPPQRRHAQWRLISHLALNHLSLSSAANSQHALREILRLYDFSDGRNTQHLAAVNRQWIEGIVDVRSRRVTRRLGGAMEGGICRGIEITLDFDEEKFGSSAFLFASVLERFLALYASLNSFVELVVTTGGSDSELNRWPPRPGEMPLL